MRIVFCILFLFVIYPISAQQNMDKSVAELENRSTILNHVDKYCKSFADKDMSYFKDNFENCFRILPNGKTESFKDYLQNLKRIFGRNQEAKAIVEDVKIIRHPVKQDFYGVSMIMTHDAGIYYDKGYFFWLIDLREPNRICTHISAWQPYESTPQEERFGIKDLNID